MKKRKRISPKHYRFCKNEKNIVSSVAGGRQSSKQTAWKSPGSNIQKIREMVLCDLFVSLTLAVTALRSNKRWHALNINIKGDDVKLFSSFLRHCPEYLVQLFPLIVTPVWPRGWEESLPRTGKKITKDDSNNYVSCEYNYGLLNISKVTMTFSTYTGTRS